MTPIEALLQTKLVVSKGEARRIIEQGGFAVGEDRIVVTDHDAEITDSVMWCGKKKAFLKLPIEDEFKKALLEFRETGGMEKLSDESNPIIRLYDSLLHFFKMGYELGKKEVDI